MALKAFVNGEVLYDTDINTYLVNVLAVEKTATTSRSNSNALAADAQLFLDVAADSQYEVSALIRVTSPAAADFSWDFTGPSGAAWTIHSSASGDSVNSRTIETGASSSPPTSGGQDYIRYYGRVKTAGTAGVFAYRWGQNTANAGSTSVQTGSFLILRRFL